MMFLLILLTWVSAGCAVAAAGPALAAAVAARRRPPAAGGRPAAAAEDGWMARLGRARRFARIRAQLPEALGAMSTAVRAGLSLPQALRETAARTPAPLGAELAAVEQQTALGGTLDAALAALERRVPLPEVRLLVSGLGLARATGASLAPLLDRIAATLRERERLRGQVRALTAQGRLSGWVVGVTPVVLLGVMLAVDPAFLDPMLRSPAGWGLLGLAAVLETAGALLIRAVVAVEP
jgi:tight adherence protein B